MHRLGAGTAIKRSRSVTVNPVTSPRRFSRLSFMRPNSSLTGRLEFLHDSSAISSSSFVIVTVSFAVGDSAEASTLPAGSSFSTRPSPATKIEPSFATQMAPGLISRGNVFSNSPFGE